MHHNLSKIKICWNTKNKHLQGCAPSKIKGSLVLWTCEIWGASIWLNEKNYDLLVAQEQHWVRRQGPVGAARVQPWCKLLFVAQ